MSFRQIPAAFLAAALLGAADRPAPLIVYSAPAGQRPAGADRIIPTDAILPNGRIAAPAGTSLFVGAATLGVALSPDGRFAILSNAGNASAGSLPGTPTGPVPGPSLTVVNAKNMRVASVYQESGAAFFMGVAAARDPQDSSRTLVFASDAGAGAVRVLDLDAAGSLTLEKIIAIAAPNARALPAAIAITPDGGHAYVADTLNDAVVDIDVAQRAVVRTLPAGDAPLYVAAGRAAVLASGTGLSSYSALESPASEPQFALPAFDPSKSSSLAVFEGSADAPADPATVPMDPAPDGTQVVGGAAPAATVITRDGRYAYVALANVDRVAVVQLAPVPRVVRGLDLRLYPGAPYGAQPSAEALSPDGKRLYVALAGLNAVAVLDARRPTRYRFGLIPTAWYPSAMALSSNGRYLYIANAKGVDGWGILQRVDLKHTSLVKTTLAALRYNRTPSVAKFNPVIPPLRSERRSAAIDHVVYLAVGLRGYDAMLGDLKDDAGAPHGNGDASFSVYGESQTPNLHALARDYALADNFYLPAAEAAVAQSYAMAGDATLYQQLVDAAPRTTGDRGGDPEDYGRTGYLFNAFARAGLTYRDYGGLLQLSGFDGSLYHLNVPALGALAGNVDLAYGDRTGQSGNKRSRGAATPAANAPVDDNALAVEFAADMQRYVNADRMPSFTYVALPTDSGASGVHDADRALGKIVEYLSHTAHWSSTVVFVVPQGIESPNDHVNAMRGYALVVSPLARRGFVGDEHLGIASVVKTEEEIFGLPPLGLNDLLASDMASFFADAPAPEPYEAR